MKGEIATVMAAINTAEAQRSKDYHALTISIDGVKSSLPTKGEMWKIVGSVVGGGMALLALLWGVFGAGAALTGSFAEKVLEQKSQQANIEGKLDTLIKAQANDDAKASPGSGQTGSVHKGTGAGSRKP